MVKKRKDFHKDIEILINTAANFIASGQLADASQCLGNALSMDFAHNRVLTGLNYIRFWEERLQSLPQEPMERAEGLLRYWKAFKKFMEPLSNDAQLIQSFRHYIFSRVLEIFTNLDISDDDQEIQLWKGIAYKGMGNYDDAEKCFSRAMQFNIPNARVLSELADTYALVGEDQKARVLCREAFYHDPQSIDVEGFESEIFIRLVKQVQEKTELTVAEELREWIPVYGTLWRILNVKRELRALEHGKLRQRIFKYEQELKEPAKFNKVLPRLLNHYFWLIDHLVMNNTDQYKINDILLKIHSISPEVHKLYTN